MFSIDTFSSWTSLTSWMFSYFSYHFILDHDCSLSHKTVELKGLSSFDYSGYALFDRGDVNNSPVQLFDLNA